MNMAQALAPWRPRVLSILRIVVALLFLEHGTVKLLGWPGPGPANLSTLLYCAALIEIIGGALVAVGLFTRLAAFIMSGEMAFAYFMSHAGTVMGPLNAPPGPGPHSFFPHLNGGEITVLYCFLWLYLASRGPGRISVDAALGRG